MQVFRDRQALHAIPELGLNCLKQPLMLKTL